MRDQWHDLIATRRQLHRRPELGFLEIETAAFVVESLRPVVDELRLGRQACDLSVATGLPHPADLAEASRRARPAGVAADLVRALEGGSTAVAARIRGERSRQPRTSPHAYLRPGRGLPRRRRAAGGVGGAV